MSRGRRLSQVARERPRVGCAVPAGLDANRGRDLDAGWNSAAPSLGDDLNAAEHFSGWADRGWPSNSAAASRSATGRRIDVLVVCASELSGKRAICSEAS